MTRPIRRCNSHLLHVKHLWVVCALHTCMHLTAPCPQFMTASGLPGACLQGVPVSAPGKGHQPGPLGIREGSYTDGSVQYHGVVVQVSLDPFANMQGVQLAACTVQHAVHIACVRVIREGSYTDGSVQYHGVVVQVSLLCHDDFYCSWLVMRVSMLDDPGRHLTVQHATCAVSHHAHVS